MGFQREMTDRALGRGHQEKEEKGGGGRDRARERAVNGSESCSGSIYEL